MQHNPDSELVEQAKQRVKECSWGASQLAAEQTFIDVREDHEF